MFSRIQTFSAHLGTAKRTTGRRMFRRQWQRGLLLEQLEDRLLLAFGTGPWALAGSTGMNDPWFADPPLDPVAADEGFAAAIAGLSQRFSINEGDDVGLSGTVQQVGILHDFHVPVKQARPFELNSLIRDHGNVNVNDTIDWGLFADRTYTAVVEAKATDVNGTTTLVTKLHDYDFAHGFIAVSGDDYLVNIDIPELREKYVTRLHPETRTPFLVQLDTESLDELEGGLPWNLQEPWDDPPGAVLPDGDPEIPLVAEPETGFSAVLGDGPLAPVGGQSDVPVNDLSDLPVQIDVMIVYTPAARNWANTYEGNIDNTIAAAMARGNLASSNSNLGITYHLVYSGEVSYTESSEGPGKDLSRLRGKTDGYMDEVHTLRDTYAADLIALLTFTNDTGGLGYLLGDRYGREDLGFSLTRVQQASWTYTVVHEIGHNMGAHHHKGQNVQPGPTMWGNWAENQWSAGWRWQGNDGKYYCSVMTYESGSYFPDGRTHTRVPHFASPDITYQGQPTGHPVDGDNARTLREVKHYVAYYKDTTTLQYCEAQGGNTSHGISRVRMGSIDQSADTRPYYDFSFQSTQISPGESEQLTVTVHNPFWNNQLLVWVDWNEDRVFQAEELVYQSGIAAVGEYVTTITVPPGTVPGPKRMRIRLHMPDFGGNSTSCGSNTNGEVQDFTVNVPDRSDIGDTLAMAEPTGIGPAPGTYSHSTLIGNGDHGDKDVDLYRFEAAAGSTVLLSTSLPAGGNPMDTILRLFDASGTQLAVNDDFGGSLYSHIEHTFASAGTYYAGVSGYPNSGYDPNVAGSGVAGSTGDYLLRLELSVPQETLYSTGFEPEEGFQPGFIGGQQGWGIWGSSAVQPVISDANPASGSQHLRLAKDPDLDEGALVGCSSAYFGHQPPGRYVVSVDVNLSATGGAGYSVLAYSHSQAANAALVGFYYGLIYVEDALDGTPQWVNTGKTWNVGTYTNLTIDIQADQDTVDYYYGGELIYSNVAGAFQATSVERVYIRSDNRNAGDVGDFDNLSVRTGGELGEIRGFKWHDLNGDGFWDAGEPGLEHWEIYLDLNDNGQWDEGEPQTTTGADGSYVFLDLVPGDYTVAEVMQDGWQQTFPFRIPAQDTAGTFGQSNPDWWDEWAVGRQEEPPSDLLTGTCWQDWIHGSGPSALRNLDLDAAAPAGDRAMQEADTRGTGVLDVYVAAGLLAEISHSLDVYASDLAAEGYQVTIQEFASDAPALRAHLQSRWADHGLEGALFVGDLPYVMLTTLEHFGDEPVEVTYPHDLYFMDLDGTYILNESGIDQHLPGDGDVGPEIYVSRITAGNLSLTGKDEATLINEYFAKVHAYRTGQLTYLNRGIVFADDDWSSWGEEQMLGLYGNVWALNDPSETTRAGYLAALAENYESILECIHSWPQGHAIQVGDTYEYLYHTDILQANPRPAFYNMFNCSSARFTENNHLIGTYVYGGDYGLNAIGSTKTGSMLFFNDFYVPQGHGASLGEAFRDWFDKWAAPTDNPGQNWMVDWFYGMTMQGDPTLRPQLMGDSSMTHRVTVLPGATVEDVDFGNRQIALGEIHGYKWHDINGDGVWDAGEPALEGWQIYLDLNHNGQWDEGEPITVTAEDGCYSFTDLQPGSYAVAEVMQEGWEQTFPGRAGGAASRFADSQRRASNGAPNHLGLAVFATPDATQGEIDATFAALRQDLNAGAVPYAGADSRVPLSGSAIGGVDVLHILVDFADMAGAPLSPIDAENMFLNVGDFLIDNTWGNFWFDTVDVTPTYRMPQTTADYVGMGVIEGSMALAQDAIAAALADGFNTADYWSYAVSFDWIQGFGYAGLGWVGAAGIWLNLFDWGTLTDWTSVAAHEFGHNLGAWHSGWWNVGGVPGDAPLDPNGTWVEYGDVFDSMGNSYALWPDNQFNSYWKTQFDWLHPVDNVLTDPAEGTYRLYAHDAYNSGAVDSVSDRIYAIELDTGFGTAYWLEYRQSLDTDPAASGLQFRLNPGWGGYPGLAGNDVNTLLIDTSGQATSGTLQQDAPLPIGQTYVSGALGLEITPLAAGIGADGNWWIDVQIGGSEPLPGTHVVTLTAGQIVDDVNFGNRQAGTLSAALVDGTLTITDMAAAGNEMTIVSVGNNLVISDANERFVSAPAGGTLSNSDRTLTIPLALITGSLILDLSGGTDVMHVASLSGGFPSLVIHGDGAADAVNFHDALTFATDRGLTIFDVGTVSLPNAASDIATSGTGAVSITALRNIVLSPGSSITTVDGEITLSANQQTPTTSGDFVGIEIDGGTIEATGSGTVTILGRGGNGADGSQYGVQVRNGGQIVGGDSGDGVVIVGTGGPGAGGANHGVQVSGSAALVISTPIPIALRDRTYHEFRNQRAFAALKSDGSVVTWGNSDWGGDSNSVADQLQSGVSQIFSSSGAFAALRSDGSVVAWGRSDWGGDSSGVAGALQSGVSRIFSTGYAFAALKSDGSVVTWGHSGYGGDSSGVAGALQNGVSQIFSTGTAFAALKSDGSVITWGYSVWGGDSSSVADQLQSGVSRIFSTSGAFAALKTDGSVVTWGGSDRGGDSSSVAGALQSGVTQIFSKSLAFAALKSDGLLVTWGHSLYGGDSSSVADMLQSGVSQVFSTGWAFAALKSDGSVITWGHDLGGGDSSSVASELQSDVSQIFPAAQAFAALKNDGSVVTWGVSTGGGDSSGVAGELQSGVSQIFSTVRAFAALKDDGSVVTWGNSDSGGDSSSVGGELQGGVSQILSTLYAFAALKSDGSTVTWGDPETGGNSSSVAGSLQSGVVAFANPFTDDWLIMREARISSRGGAVSVTGIEGGGTDSLAIRLADDAAITTDEHGGNISLTGNSLLAAGARIAASGNGAVTITALRNIVLSPGSSITAEDGDITLLANPGGSTTGNFAGIAANNATIQTSGSGAISLIGFGADNGNVNPWQYGIVLHNGTIVRSTASGVDAGTITIDGTGGNGTDSNRGVWMWGSHVTSVDGDVLITGRGGDGVGGSHPGVVIGSAAIISSTGTGTNAARISIEGTGGAGTGANIGVSISGPGTQVTSVAGDILITGQGGDGSSLNNRGVDISSGAVVSSTGQGLDAAKIAIDGAGGAGTTYIHGVFMFGSVVTSIDGDILITGRAGFGTGNENRGVRITSDAVIASIGTGPHAATITIDGTGGGTDGSSNNNHGVHVQTTAARLRSVDGDIRISGAAGVGDSFAIQLVDEFAIEVTAGGSADVTLIGDSMDIAATNAIAAAGKTVTLKTRTTDGSIGIDVGGADTATELGVTNDELSRITAGTIVIGDAEIHNTIAVTGEIEHAGDANFEVVTARNIVFDSGIWRTSAGNLTFVANNGGSTPGSFRGIEADNATIETNSTGDIALVAFGADTGNASSMQDGVVLRGGTIVRSTASGADAGTITIDGTGGNGMGAVGVVVAESHVTSIDGDILITGRGGRESSTHSVGVQVSWATVSSTGTGSDAATITINGTGGGTDGSGGFNWGVLISMLTSADGDIRLTGTAGVGFSFAIAVGVIEVTAGGSADVTLIGDSMDIVGTNGVAAGGNTVTLRPETAGTRIDLGGADVLTGSPRTLGLTIEELGRITAGTLIIGDPDTGTITLTAPITRPAGTSFELHGDAVRPLAPGTDITGATVSFAAGTQLAINIDGTAVDGDYSQLRVAGTVDLAGTVLGLSGSYTPVAGDAFTIVSATSPVLGTFVGLPEGAVIENFLGSGLSATITYIGGEGNDVVLDVQSYSTRIDMTIVHQPSAIGDHGQVASLPASAGWVHEWQSFWVEIWVSTPGSTEVGVAEAKVDLQYHTGFLTAQEIEYSLAWDYLEIPIDGQANFVTLHGWTERTDVGDDAYVLLARVRFASTGDDDVPVDEAGGNIGPYDMQLTLENGQNRLAGANELAAAELGAAPETELWAVVYDIDDTNQIDFGDFSFFAAAFGKNAGPPSSQSPYTWWADFDKTGRVDFGDLAFFAPNFGKTRDLVQAGDQTLVFPRNFPDAWRAGAGGGDSEGEGQLVGGKGEGSDGGGMDHPSLASTVLLAGRDGLRQSRQPQEDPGSAALVAHPALFRSSPPTLATNPTMAGTDATFAQIGGLDDPLGFAAIRRMDRWTDDGDPLEDVLALLAEDLPSRLLSGKLLPQAAPSYR